MCHLCMNGGPALHNITMDNSDSTQSAPDFERDFPVLYDETSARLHAYCRRLLGRDHGGADDVFQQAYVSLFEQLRSGAEIANRPAYLFRIARNHCYNLLTRGNTVPLEQALDALQAEEQYDRKELLSLLHAAMDRLPEDARELLALREQLGMSYEEITAITGLNSAVARQRVSRAKRMLRALLAPYIEDLEQ